MNVALRRGMTAEQFLEWEERQEERWEFDGFEPVGMVGATLGHNRICRNLSNALTHRLRGGPCDIFVETAKIATAASIRYPDAVVACGANANDATMAQNPVVVFEVLSPSTALADQMVKNAEYRATPSIQRYVMLAQDQVGAATYERRGPDWVGTLVTDPAAILDMPEIAVSLPLAELYEGVIDIP